MSHPSGQPHDGAEADREAVVAYYDALTELVASHPLGLMSYHTGLRSAETKSDKDAVLRQNHTLTEGCGLGPAHRVLDAGCGWGGPAVWIAETFGASVVGLTNCPRHIGVASRYAGERGVAHLVEFRLGDFMDMPFPDDSFDTVLNQESVCYASDNLGYLRGVRRVLKPGGRWQAVDYFWSGAPLSTAQEEIRAAVEAGFHVPPRPSCRQMLAALAQAGFRQMRERTLTDEAARSARSVARQWDVFGAWARAATGYRISQANVDAFRLYDRGLREGVFSYHLISGVAGTAAERRADG